ncbi:MAG TPA: UGSC family (seleno)protein [Ramlibacter sp.]|nr:UGSC family (seleno)protein [Ramlibacter sp.]
MLRASAACEAAGIPTSSLTCEGFVGQAHATCAGLGLRGMPLAVVPGHPGVQSQDELRRNTIESVLPAVVANLTQPPTAGAAVAEPRARDIVARGSHAEVNEQFLQQDWGDGLPIVPPTRERVQQFLAHTSRDPEHVIGVMLPDQRTATVWSVAVNGVMAGCRPEYMPVLVALAEAMADPAYGVEHSGNTPGAETLIVLNGPIVRELGFNYTQGVMRDGFQPNTSIGRFWRLYLRNVVGFLPHRTDKATFGNTWRVVVPENEEVLARIGWPPLCADFGLAPGANAVTIARHTGGDVLSSVSGSTPEELLPYIADGLYRRYSWQLLFSTSFGSGSLRPLVLLTPILAETIAKAGWSKADVQAFLFEHARIPAWEFERIMRDWNKRQIWNLTEDARAGRIPALYAQSDDPQRRVPLVWKPEHYLIGVTGDPLRTNAYVFAHNGNLGFPVSKRITP